MTGRGYPRLMSIEPKTTALASALATGDLDDRAERARLVRSFALDPTHVVSPGRLLAVQQVMLQASAFLGAPSEESFGRVRAAVESLGSAWDVGEGTESRRRRALRVAADAIASWRPGDDDAVTSEESVIYDFIDGLQGVDGSFGRMTDDQASRLLRDFAPRGAFILAAASESGMRRVRR